MNFYSHTVDSQYSGLSIQWTLNTVDSQYSGLSIQWTLNTVNISDPQIIIFMNFFKYQEIKFSSNVLLTMPGFHKFMSARKWHYKSM